MDNTLTALSLKELEALRKKALIARSREFSVSGFLAFFELFHVIPIHAAGERWATEVFQAHRDGLGYMNKAHRESAKSTFAKFFLAFYIGHHPEKSSMIVRINDDKANETTQSIANIIEHDPRWKMVFPNVVPDKDIGWGAQGYEVKDTSYPSYAAWREVKTALLPDPSFVGYGYKSGSIIGSRCNGCALVDDILDENNTSSDRQQKAVKKWHSDTFDPVIMEGAFEIWNYTPWLDNDLYADLEASDTYLVSATPLLVRVEEGTPGADYWPEDPLVPMSGKWYLKYWEEAWPWDRITRKYKRSGQVGFARMYMLDLEAVKGLNLKREWIHYYPADQIDPTWPVFFGVDYASTADKMRNKDRDYFAMAIARGIPGGGLVIVDGVRKRQSKGESLATIAAYMAMYPTLVTIGVENIGKGEEFYNDLLLMDDVSGRIPPLMPVKHGRQSKGSRFEDWLAPRCQAARIWFSNVKTPFMISFENEWLSYPDGSHDDAIDAVYMVAKAGEGKLGVRRTGGRGQAKKKRARNPYDSIRS